MYYVNKVDVDMKETVLYFLHVIEVKCIILKTTLTLGLTAAIQTPGFVW